MFEDFKNYVIDVESVYFLLVELVKQLGETEECKNVFLSVCDCLFNSSMSTPLKARMCAIVFDF